MVDKLGLSFGLLISLFFPGFVVVLSLAVCFHVQILGWEQLSSLGSLVSLSSLVVAIGTSLSVIIGLVLDAVRAFLFYILRFLLKKASKSFEKLHDYSMSEANEDDLNYYNLVVENHFRFHQFYCNLFLSVAFAIYLLRDLIDGICAWIVVAMLVLVIGCSAVLSYITAVKKLHARFGNMKKERRTL